MTDKIFEPFSNATREVCKLMLDMDAVVGAVESPDSLKVLQDKVTIMIGFTGDYSGETYYIFPEKTALEIVKSMSGMEIEEIDDFVTSAMSEISNIISGNAMTGLCESAIACDIQPPKVISGETVIDGDTPSHDARLINTGIKTPVGDIELVVKVRVG